MCRPRSKDISPAAGSRRAMRRSNSSGHGRHGDPPGEKGAGPIVRRKVKMSC